MSGAILHITSKNAWRDALATGLYEPDSLSVEGFIHCSTAAQVLSVANAFYSGRRDLLLLVIDPDRLTGELRWEAPSEAHPDLGGAGVRFPHLYGPLNLDAVTKVVDFEPDESGRFIALPDV